MTAEIFPIGWEQWSHIPKKVSKHWAPKNMKDAPWRCIIICLIMHCWAPVGQENLNMARGKNQKQTKQKGKPLHSVKRKTEADFSHQKRQAWRHCSDAFRFKKIRTVNLESSGDSVQIWRWNKSVSDIQSWKNPSAADLCCEKCFKKSFRQKKNDTRWKSPSTQSSKERWIWQICG